MSNRLPYRHLSGRFDGWRNETPSNRHGHRFLRHVNQQIVDTLTRAGLWPRVIGKATAIRLVDAVLGRDRVKACIRIPALPSIRAKLRIECEQLDVYVCDDKWPAQTGQPYLTTLADDYTGVVVAYALSYVVPTRSALAGALAGLPSPGPWPFYIDLFGVRE